MIIDTLTIAGFISAASFLLMPILMKKEFIRVEGGDEQQPQAFRTQNRDHVDSDASLSTGSITTA